MRFIFQPFLFLIVCFAVFPSSAQSQTKYKGYLYTLNNHSKAEFQYTISTIISDSVYKTIYKIYKQGARKNRYTIIASHSKEAKKVSVKINDEVYLLSVMDGEWETEYSEPTLKSFGFRGNLGMFDKSAPDQLAVKFVSPRYEYVKVLNFLGSYSDNIAQYFIFDGKENVAEPKKQIVNLSKSQKAATDIQNLHEEPLPMKMKQEAVSGVEEKKFIRIDEESEYVGGSQGIAKFLSDNLKYPDSALNNEVEGVISVNFLIDKNGEVKNIYVNPEDWAKGHGLPEEAIRVVASMPKWKPAISKGKPVISHKKLPITFRLEIEAQIEDKPKAKMPKRN